MAPQNYSDFIVTSPFTPYAWGMPGSVVNLNNANDIALYSFVVPFPLKVTDICVFIYTGDASNDSDVGIYDVSGNLVAHAGPQRISAGAIALTITGGPVVIGPGTYLLAFTSAGTTLKWAIAATSASNDGLKWFSAGSNASAGTLPSTITVNHGLSEGDAFPYPDCRPILLLK